MLDTKKEAGIDRRTNIGVEFTVTNKCNCRCDYCFECSHEDISSKEEEARQVELLLNYCRNFDRLKHRYLNVIFWGGEPMLNTDFLYKLINVSKDYDFVTYLMYSNGTTYEKYKDFVNQDFFKEIFNRFAIQLSYDGEPHNSIKRKTNGELIFKTADLLISRGIDVSFKATLSLDMLDKLPEIWDSYEKLHSRYGFVYYSPTIDQTDSSTISSSFESWKKVLPKIAGKEIGFIKKNGRPLWSWFGSPGKLACDPNDTVHIHCDGNLYVCHGCQYQKNPEVFAIGKTSDDFDFDKMLNSGFKTNMRLLKCVKCPAVVCSVCHVKEISEMENPENYKELWARSMVNNPDRCRFFQYFGIVYQAFRTAITGMI